MTRVSVIVPARDSAATLGRTLEALAAQELDESYEVIVVDDGSTDDTAAIAERAPGAVTVLRQPGRGMSAARNRGVEAASGEVLAFTDADCFPTPGWLAAGLRALGEVDLVQGAVRPDPGAALGPFDRTLWVVGEAGLYETANLFVRRDAFERAGGFEDWLEATVGKPLAEDLWLGWRIRRSGGRTRFEPEALVHHAVFPRRGREFIRERRRLRYFADIAAKVPEIRGTAFVARVFVSRRTAAFDVAVAGCALAALARSPLPLAAAGPYALAILRLSVPWGAPAPRIAAGYVAADAVGLVSLVAGSVRRRTLVL